jgi:hypothetical protein
MSSPENLQQEIICGKTEEVKLKRFGSKHFSESVKKSDFLKKSDFWFS